MAFIQYFSQEKAIFLCQLRLQQHDNSTREKTKKQPALSRGSSDSGTKAPKGLLALSAFSSSGTFQWVWFVLLHCLCSPHPSGCHSSSSPHNCPIWGGYLNLDFCLSYQKQHLTWHLLYMLTKRRRCCNLCLINHLLLLLDSQARWGHQLFNCLFHMQIRNTVCLGYPGFSFKSKLVQVPHD